MKELTTKEIIDLLTKANQLKAVILIQNEVIDRLTPKVTASVNVSAGTCHTYKDPFFMGSVTFSTSHYPSDGVRFDGGRRRY